jgi:hypothetical protein
MHESVAERAFEPADGLARFGRIIVKFERRDRNSGYSGLQLSEQV